MTAHDNDNAQTEISALLAAIRAWQRADAVYREVCYTVGGALATLKADTERNRAARRVCGKSHNNATLAAFTALADHVDSLQATIDRALRIEGWYPEEYEISDYTRGGNHMRDEFHKQLTAGDSEGEA